MAVGKRVWVRIDRNNPQITLREVADRISELQAEHPELDVFFDGDEFAICSRPREPSPKKEGEGESEGEKKKGG